MTCPWNLVRGHLRLLKMAKIDRLRTSSYSYCVATFCHAWNIRILIDWLIISRIISEIERDIGKKSLYIYIKQPPVENGCEYFCAVFLQPSQIPGIRDVNRCCKQSSLYSQLKRVTDRHADWQVEREAISIAEHLVHVRSKTERKILSKL